ncbi:TIGR01620 family protein [Celeribacter halophilus]|uniref:TIGR01620 family protein n=1 Tax=Celeribacter halophilus TaxID=576117 RepID=A0AAW7XUS2_9RHOB|nr:TIGR01620 family protein [Celeribacter halophilus]MDO6456593.1 TIGR01620 family protein [Celeribacter halophilus]MDO6723056.1 TIGR01620 family protein [Celeribacter halophilus]
MSEHPPEKRGPVLIELEDEATVNPSTAEPVPDLAPLARPAAMERVAVLAARKPSTLARWFWRLFAALFTFVLSLAAYDFIAGLIARNQVLGYVALGLTGAFLVVLAAIALKELSAFARLKRIDSLQSAATDAVGQGDLKAARGVSDKLVALYAHRDELSWGRERFAERQGELFDADGVLGLAEAELLAPLDAAARREVEAAARQVATVTALVPLALADVFAALTANLRMIRRIAEIYGGRSGTLGSWRVTRSVLTHLVATGAVAVGDDLIGTMAGGGVMAKISRRFGEGVVNGALTARVGVAAIEVCRPLPFMKLSKPSVSGTVKRALTGLFDKGAEKSAG